MLKQLFLFAFCCGAAAVLAGCDRAGSATDDGAAAPALDTTDANDPPGPRSAAEQGEIAPEPPAPEGPRITFTQLVHDFGRISDVDKQPCRFPFTNTGGERLIISDIKASCGCTATSLGKREFEPGEGSALEVVYRPGGQGRQNKRIRIFSNDPTREVAELTVSAEVEPFILVEPRTVRFGTTRLGVEHRAVCTISCRDPNMIIESLRAGGQHFSARLIADESPAGPEPEPGAEAGAGPGAEAGAGPGAEPLRLEIILHDTAPWGSVHSTVTLKCRGRLSPEAEEVVKTVRIVAGATVFGELHADRTMFMLSSVPPGSPLEGRVRLTRPSGEPFQIVSHEISQSSQEGMSVRAEPIPVAGVSGYDLILTGQAGEKEGRVRGTVIVTTDVPGEERLSFLFSGVVRNASE